MAGDMLNNSVSWDGFVKNQKSPAARHSVIAPADDMKIETFRHQADYSDVSTCPPMVNNFMASPINNSSSNNKAAPLRMSSSSSDLTNVTHMSLADGGSITVPQNNSNNGNGQQQRHRHLVNGVHHQHGGGIGSSSSSGTSVFDSTPPLRFVIFPSVPRNKVYMKPQAQICTGVWLLENQSVFR